MPAKVAAPEGWTHDDRDSGEVRWTADDGHRDQARAARRTSRSGSARCRSAPRIVFKALQHYADGQVVRWIQDPDGRAERPAAVLDLGGQVGLDGDVDRPDEAATTRALVIGVALGVFGIVACSRSSSGAGGCNAARASAASTGCEEATPPCSPPPGPTRARSASSTTATRTACSATTSDAAATRTPPTS